MLRAPHLTRLGRPHTIRRMTTASTLGALERVYSVEQAERTLPYVSRIVQDIVTHHARWRELLGDTELPAAFSTAERPDPRALSGERELRALALALDDFRRELAALGIELKDPARGLVDFPAVLDGRPVYLSWRLGEPRVAYWHERGSVFGGRRRLALAGPAARSV